MLFISKRLELQKWDQLHMTLWLKIEKNTDVIAGPLARPFSRTAHSFAGSRLLVCSLAHFAHGLARGTMIYMMAMLSVFFSIFDHSV